MHTYAHICIYVWSAHEYALYVLYSIALDMSIYHFSSYLILNMQLNIYEYPYFTQYTFELQYYPKMPCAHRTHELNLP